MFIRIFFYFTFESDCLQNWYHFLMAIFERSKQNRRASTAQATAVAQRQVDSAVDARVKELETENADYKKRLNDQVS